MSVTDLEGKHSESAPSWGKPSQSIKYSDWNEHL